MQWTFFIGEAVHVVIPWFSFMHPGSQTVAHHAVLHVRHFSLFNLPTYARSIVLFASSYAQILPISALALDRTSSRSLKRSPNRSKCGRMTMVYLTSSSMQSTSRSRFELAIIRLPSVSGVNCVYALGTELWLGMANIRIHRPRIRSEFTELKDCDPPLTCAMARVLPWVGRTDPDDKGIQSICCLKMPVCSNC